VALLVTIPLLSHRWYLVGAALGDLISVALLTVSLYVTTRVATRLIDRGILAPLAVPIIAAALAGALSWNIGALVSPNPLRLASEVGIAAIGYVLFIFVLGGRNRLFDLFGLLRAASQRTAVA
ncbi:MAG: hypothetical protein WAV20_03825, partial [Blastocatellia bacterium]